MSRLSSVHFNSLAFGFKRRVKLGISGSVSCHMRIWEWDYSRALVVGRSTLQFGAKVGDCNEMLFGIEWGRWRPPVAFWREPGTPQSCTRVHIFCKSPSNGWEEFLKKQVFMDENNWFHLFFLVIIWSADRGESLTSVLVFWFKCLFRGLLKVPSRERWFPQRIMAASNVIVQNQV